MGTMVPGVILAGGGIPGRGSLSVASKLSIATLKAMLKQAKGGNNDKMPTKNQWFHRFLFGEYRDKEVGGRKITSRSVRASTKLGKIPLLPLLKVDGKEMCLAWHTKVMCNPGQCSQECDHVEYSEQEYAPLSQWCKDHYPK